MMSQLASDDEYSILQFYFTLSGDEKISMMNDYMQKFRVEGFKALPKIPLDVNHLIGDHGDHIYEDELWENIQ